MAGEDTLARLQRDRDNPNLAFYIRPDGILVSIPRADEDLAEAAGYRPADTPDFEDYRNRQLYGNSEIRAGLEGAARGATFGLSDQLLTYYGAEPEGLRGREEQNPVASTVGELTGIGVPLLLSGGSSAAATGARAVGALPLAAQSAGRAVEGAVASRLAGAAVKEGLAGAIARTVPKVAGSAVEGAFYGAGSAISEDALGKHELTAEHLLASAGLGALIGGAASGAISLAGEGTTASRKALARLFERETGVKVKHGEIPWDSPELDKVGTIDPRTGLEIVDEPGALRKAYSEVSSAVSGADQQRILQFMQKSNTGRQYRRLATDQSEDLELNISQMVKSVDKIEGSFRTLSDLATGADKAKRFGKLVANVDDALVANTSRGTVDGVKAKIDNMLAAGDKEFGFINKLKHAEKTTENALKNLSLAPTSGDRFIVVDTLKRDLGKLRDSMNATRNAPSHDQATADAFIGLYDDLKKHLEDPSIYGKYAAEAQTSINQKWEQLLSRNSYRNDFFTPWETKNFEVQWRANPKRFNEFVKGLRQTKTDAEYEWITGQIKRKIELADEIAKHYELDPAAKAALNDLKQHAKNFQNNLEFAEHRSILQNQLAELERVPSPFGGAAAGGLGGYVIGGPGGAAIGAGLGFARDKLANPGKAIRQLAALERMQERYRARLGANMDAFTERAKGVAAKASKAKVLVVPASVNILQSTSYAGKPDKEPATRQAAYERRLGELSSLMVNPNVLTERIARSTDQWATSAPKTAAALNQKMLTALQFLYERAPKPPTIQGPFAYKYAPSEAQLAKWARYVAAVEDPGSVIEDMNAGRVSREGVETLRVVYPEIYGQIVNDLTMRITELKHLPFAQRQQLSVLFGVPIEATTDPATLAAIQASYQPPEPNKPGPKAKVSGMDTAVTTEAGAIENK